MIVYMYRWWNEKNWWKFAHQSVDCLSIHNICREHTYVRVWILCESSNNLCCCSALIRLAYGSIINPIFGFEIDLGVLIFELKWCWWWSSCSSQIAVHHLMLVFLKMHTSLLCYTNIMVVNVVAMLAIVYYSTMSQEGPQTV